MAQGKFCFSKIVHPFHINTEINRLLNLKVVFYLTVLKD